VNPWRPTNPASLLGRKGKGRASRFTQRISWKEKNVGKLGSQGRKKEGDEKSTVVRQPGKLRDQGKTQRAGWGVNPGDS